MDKVVFWDFYNTLAYCGCLYGKALKGVLDEFEPGNNFSYEEINRNIARRFTWDNPEKDYSRIKDPEKWWEYTNPIFTEAFEIIGVSRKNAEMYAKNVRRYISDIKLYTLFPETLDALELLKKNGYSQYILSNFAPELPHIIEGLGIGHYFKDYFVSSLSGYEKPNELLYKIALVKTGNPEKAWMIGDSFEADYKGAVSCGMRAVLVRNEPPAPADFYARDIKLAAELIIIQDKNI